MRDGLLYVGVEQPNTIRKDMLEASKELIHFLQRYEKIKSIKAEKHRHIAELKIIHTDILHLMRAMLSELPPIDVKTLPKEEEKPVVHHEKKAKHAAAEEEAAQKEHPAPKKKATPIDKLESQLAAIEEKLKRVG